METFGRLLLAATISAAAVGCGRADVSTDASTTQPTPQGSSVQPTPTPSAPAGFYVDVQRGSDANDGSIEHPFATIGYAIREASSSTHNDVWVFTGTYVEIVEIAPGVNLHGGVCPGTQVPLKIDPVNCPSAIQGGSPTVIARGIHTPTRIENFLIDSLPAVQTSNSLDGNYFQIDGLGCVGRGVSNTFSACQRAPGPDGKPIAVPSMAVAVVDSSDLHFLNDDIRSEKGGDGLAGDDAAPAVMTPPVQYAGGNADGTTDADKPWRAGVGAPGVAAPECPDGRGGDGGLGGRWYWDGTSGTYQTILVGGSYKKVFYPTLNTSNTSSNGHAGLPGGQADIRGTAIGGAGGTWDWDINKAPDGLNGQNGEPGLAGHDGAGGAHDLDPATLAALDGKAGDRGATGAGGAGGGGGGPATRFHFIKKTTSSGVSLFKFLGIDYSHTSTHTQESQQGENAAGGGGAGGAGGCGGNGGKAGHGGAASVAVYLMNATVDLQGSHVLAGPGGNGGVGGGWSDGIDGLAGTPGGMGGSSAPINVQTSNGFTGGFTAGGVWGDDNAATVTFTNSSTDGWGGSKAGSGGAGGNGAKGGRGGVGGGGAGGSSIGILVQGTGAAGSTLATIETSAAGIGGGTGTSKGQDGVQMGVYPLGSPMP